jgi:hypothetical protein
MVLGTETPKGAHKLVYWAGLAEQGCAADRLQRTLLRRSRFQRRLTPGVRQLREKT